MILSLYRAQQLCPHAADPVGQPGQEIGGHFLRQGFSLRRGFFFLLLFLFRADGAFQGTYLQDGIRGLFQDRVQQVLAPYLVFAAMGCGVCGGFQVLLHSGRIAFGAVLQLMPHLGTGAVGIHAFFFKQRPDCGNVRVYGLQVLFRQIEGIFCLDLGKFQQAQKEVLDPELFGAGVAAFRLGAQHHEFHRIGQIHPGQFLSVLLSAALSADGLRSSGHNLLNSTTAASCGSSGLYRTVTGPCPSWSSPSMGSKMSEDTL